MRGSTKFQIQLTDHGGVMSMVISSCFFVMMVTAIVASRLHPGSGDEEEEEEKEVENDQVASVSDRDHPRHLGPLFLLFFILFSLYFGSFVYF